MLYMLGNFMVSMLFSLMPILNLVADNPPMLQGHTAIVVLKSGDVFSGIFFGATLENNESAYILKMVQQLKSIGRHEVNGTQDDSEAFVGVGGDHTMTFDLKDISGLTVEGIDFYAQEKLQNGKSFGLYFLMSKTKASRQDLHQGFAPMPISLATWRFVSDSSNAGLPLLRVMSICHSKLLDQVGNGINLKLTKSFSV